MINTSMSMMNFSIQSTSSTGPQNGNRPPGPPPPGATPPGLEGPVSTLSESDQASVKSMLESFSPEQHEQLKAMLDEFKSSADSMTQEDIGIAFYDMLLEVSGSTASADQNGSTFGIDTYA